MSEMGFDGGGDEGKMGFPIWVSLGYAPGSNSSPL
jgi:hypothetical protein